MNISTKWLADYVTVECPLETLCARLTMAGIEVESVESSSTIPDGVVAGKILSRDPHPDSDHLSVCKVFDGKEELQIVCGAPNCDAGKIVPLATIGTVFTTPEGEFKIKKSKLRGVPSFGMMCSAAELGISEDNSGLLILDENVKPGTPIIELFPGETKIELEVTPNRSDWLSMYGIARDVSCLLDSPARLPEFKRYSSDVKAPGLVTIEAQDLCSRYTGRIIRNVKVGPSPAWMVERLESVGLRSIDNVVDITNFVMLELGQPLHAFDLKKLKEQRIVVRRAKPGEKIVTLDGKELELQERHLVIADAEKPVALAGVMGGEFSGVSAETTDVLLESAVFDRSSIRATSRELGISTDASYRFERGVDYDMAELAAERAAQLLVEVAGGEVATELVDVNFGRPAEKVIPCRFDRIRKLLGYDVSNARIEEIFRKLHLQVTDVTEQGCVVTAPLFRLDLEREADLAEEVARINGLDQIPEIPVKAVVCHSIREDAHFGLQVLRDEMVNLGFYECLHYSTVTGKSAAADSRFVESDWVKLKNPINQEQAWMRPALLGEMLGTIARNFSRGNRDLALFELDKCFCANPAKYPEERYELLFALTGRRNPELYSEAGKALFDFYDIKGTIESLFEAIGLRNYRLMPVADRSFRENCAAQVLIEGKPAGVFGELAPELCKDWRSSTPVFVARIDVEPLLNAPGRTGNKYKALALYPAIERDIAFVAPAELEHTQIVEFIRKRKPKFFESVRLFDIFSDDKLAAAGKKSLAYTLTFRNPERTLTDDEINQSVEKLRQQLAQDLKVELR